MKEYLVRPGGKVKLAAWDANDTGDFLGNKQQAKLVGRMTLTWPSELFRIRGGS